MTKASNHSALFLLSSCFFPLFYNAEYEKEEVWRKDISLLCWFSIVLNVLMFTFHSCKCLFLDIFFAIFIWKNEMNKSHEIHLNSREIWKRWLIYMYISTIWWVWMSRFLLKCEIPMHTCFIAITITHEILLHRVVLWVRA